jgi:hypothetical protein
MKLIEIVKNNYGMTTKEAKNYIKTINEETKKALFDGFYKNAKKSFYND